MEATDGHFLHLLTVAETAKGVPDITAHIQRYRTVLLEARDTLENLAQTETLARHPQTRHHVLPQQGG